MSPDGTIAANAEEFGTSWVTGYASNCARLAIISESVSVCDTFKGETFSKCHSSVSVQLFHDNCIFDHFNCSAEDHGQFLCESLATYASACAAKGVRLPNWRDLHCCKLYKLNAYLVWHCPPLCMKSKVFGLYFTRPLLFVKGLKAPDYFLPW